MVKINIIKNFIMIKYLFVIIIFFFIECENKKYYPPTIKTNINEKNLFYRDSLYITYTVEKFLETGYRHYKGYHVVDSLYKQIDTIWTDLIFYDPDILKIFGIVIIKVPPSNFFNKISYDAKAIVGFREKLNQPWKIYPLSEYQTSRLTVYKKASNFIRKFYFFELKDYSQYFKVGSQYKTGNYKLKNFKYNIDDPEFWQGLMWQRGNRVPGLYYFQTKENISEQWNKNANPFTEVPLLQINYPDSIIALF